MREKLMTYNDKKARNYSFDATNNTYSSSQIHYNDGGLTPDEEENLQKIHPEFSNPAEVKWNHQSFSKKLAYAVNEALKG